MADRLFDIALTYYFTELHSDREQTIDCRMLFLIADSDRLYVSFNILFY